MSGVSPTWLRQHNTTQPAPLPLPLWTLLLIISALLPLGVSLEPSVGDVLDLLHGLNTSTHSGTLHYQVGTSAPVPERPVLILDDVERSLALPSHTAEQAIQLLAKHSALTFFFAVKQDLGNSGTLLAFSSDTTRYLEVESSSRRDEIRLHYTHQRLVHVETFPYRLADGHWHRLAFTLNGDHVAMFVDCNRIYQRVILTPDLDLAASTSSTISLFVGQRNRQHSLFRGALQDVKIVTQAHGLLQCPEAESECSTCTKFQDLEQRVFTISSMYKDLSLQLIKAEERLANLEQCECLQYCYDNGTQRREGEEWKKDKCNTCRCKNGSVECHVQQCPSLECENPVYRDGECCPICLTNCYYSGKYYDHGDEVSPIVCVTCKCDNGNMVCERQDTEKTCPKLDCPPSERIEIHGQCCPICKGTDYCSQGHNCHVNASCVNLATKFACHCHGGFEGDGVHCEDIDECQRNGGQGGHHCPKGSTCVNIPGAYRCTDCQDGSGDCSGHDACVQGDKRCHSQAQCVKVNGTFGCACREGYQGDGYTCKADCHGECRNGGTCIAPNICECRHGWIGPNCEHDINECALGIAKCHGHSVCVNRPGWYHCDCLEGYHSSWPDNHYGSLCLDIDECKNEGEGHSCHYTMQCVNTAGAYQCQCPPGNVCTHNCIFEGADHDNGTVWRSPLDKCKECRCEDGRTICHQAKCDCKDPHVDLTCCPRCDVVSTCPHQELDRVHQSGDIWTYQCQSCECLEGEIDCQPIRCPQVSCANPRRLPGDCCPVCADANPCMALTHGTGGQDMSHSTCTYMGQEFSHGEEWPLEGDQCTTCQCKAGHICCSFKQTCTAPYSHT